MEKGFENQDQIQKSDLMEAISSGQNKVCVSKSGREIKKQVFEVLRPLYEKRLDDTIDEANALLDKCGDSPKMDPDFYLAKEYDIKIPFKMYGYYETYCSNDGSNDCLAPSISNDGKNINYPKDNDQAECRMKYNECVRRIVMIEVDIKACDVLEKIDDDKRFDLTPQQIIAMKF